MGVSSGMSRVLRIFRGALVAQVACLIALAVEPAGAAAGKTVRYNRDIRPILSENCFACHGPDSAARKAELRLDRSEDAVAVRKGTAAIVPGDLVKSELVARITATDPDDVMPPPKSHKKLTAEQIELLKKWVAEGAEYELHWAYIAPERPSL